MWWTINIIIFVIGIGLIAWAFAAERYDSLGFTVLGVLVIAIAALSSLVKLVTG